MMAWFGFALTGRTIEIALGRIVPEYSMPDLRQLSIGLGDPDGWRNTTNGSAGTAPVQWTTVKHLYR